MSTTSSGRSAEQYVVDYLVNKEHQIIDTNWRTRYCEIDIVSKKGNIIYFTEVRYRKSSYWGSGLDTITTKKLNQMRFAAKFWISTNKWNGSAQILAASVCGNPYELESIIEIE